ncbi:MAG: PilZ domain-containing protein [Planctomycetes bacterium]|nr:PilZ domain-containing protein [Planctomycetota bacterium]
METLVEHRNDTRTDLSWPVSVWLPQANRFFNGRSSNISKNGVFISLPMTTPLKDGNILEVNFPRTSDLAEEKGQFARIKTGKVVRVERSNIFNDATIGVAVEFE